MRETNRRRLRALLGKAGELLRRPFKSEPSEHACCWGHEDCAAYPLGPCAIEALGKIAADVSGLGAQDERAVLTIRANDPASHLAPVRSTVRQFCESHEHDPLACVLVRCLQVGDATDIGPKMASVTVRRIA